ncbi:hypothetical protein [Borreliella garinii]|uniref:hypothetical protein n=1 Tax=Borreliella garinii TaxID=29519 RepID=UPI00018E25DD|nr:hypothetical protein [Borreliella garinii]EED29884.1 conserved hypothetical protein [Borreliella garinii Far04]WNZ66928.1 hypothetical protein PT139_03735 [Borreliella garinii]WNZ67923.1 hypothetical protein PT135_03725 [Borreliella garinii]WNZ68920.1 hypothetical protein PT138_03725 [Borreliella garinii]WNZ69920.1 hypothetical protein PT140_03720 [Borreliella garinii]
MTRKIFATALIFLISNNYIFAKDTIKDLFFIQDILIKKEKYSEVLNNASLEGIIEIEHKGSYIKDNDSEVKLILKENGYRRNFSFFNLLNTSNIIKSLSLFDNRPKSIKENEIVLLGTKTIKENPNKRHKDDDDFELKLSVTRKSNQIYLILDFEFLFDQRKTFPSIYIKEEDVSTIINSFMKLQDSSFLSPQAFLNN